MIIGNANPYPMVGAQKCSKKLGPIDKFIAASTSASEELKRNVLTTINWYLVTQVHSTP